MFDLTTLLTYTLAAFALILVPGPTVSLIIANSLRRGVGAGLANVAGTQLGLATMILALAFGLDAVVQLMGEAFVWVKLAGAAYLIWLGIKMIRSDGELATAKGVTRSPLGYVVQGFLVIWSNPKALLFFGAFIPQFVDPDYATAPQVIVYGAIFMAAGAIGDGAWALAAGKAGRLLTRRRVRAVEVGAGGTLVVGGAMLALVRR